MSFLAPAMPFLSMIGTAVSVVGSLSQGRAQNREAQHQAQIAEMNARELEADRQHEALRTADEVRRLEEQRRTDIGRLKARSGMAGVQLEGSPLLALEESLFNFERDIQATRMIGFQGDRRLTGQAAIQRAEGASALRQGRQAQTASLFRAGSTLITAGMKHIPKPKATG